jgi:hypothetical protein
MPQVRVGHQAGFASELMAAVRFATELAGRKARKRTWEGLGEEMARAGWFDG